MTISNFRKKGLQIEAPFGYDGSCDGNSNIGLCRSRATINNLPTPFGDRFQEGKGNYWKCLDLQFYNDDFFETIKYDLRITCFYKNLIYFKNWTLNVGRN